MKCLNLYAVFGTDAKRGALEHFPVFADAGGAQYIQSARLVASAK
jgi:hypothetical protein